MTKVASFVRDCFPEPLTPISIAEPRGCASIHDIRVICTIAISKKTKFILPECYLL